MLLNNVIFKRSRMGEFFAADRTHNFLVLFDMTHVLALAFTMYVFQMLIKVVSLVKPGRTSVTNKKNSHNLTFIWLYIYNSNILFL